MKNKIILLGILIICILFTDISFASPTRTVGDPAAIKDIMINNTSSESINITDNDGLDVLGLISVWLKESLTSLLMVSAIGVFLFIGAKLAFARGNPEEFKKAMLQFVYAVVGVFVISVSYAVVKLVAGINF